MSANKDKRHNKDFNADRRENRLAKLATKRSDEKRQKRAKFYDENA